MPRMRAGTIHRIVPLIVALGLAAASSAGVSAQANLLRDPGFENQSYKNVAVGSDGASFNVPADWSGWYAQSPRDRGAWQNLTPNGAPHTGGFKREGSRTLNIGRGSATFTAAVYQQVQVAAGTNVRASAWAFIENVSERASVIRIGIDPNGGSDPTSPAIIWSPFARTVQAWNQVTVDATVVGSGVTVFLYATQDWPNDPNNIYWDDSSLIVGGAGGTSSVNAAGTLVPTARPIVAVVPFVSAQGPRRNGSIVHVVGAGDTIDSIAVAYHVTRQDIMELNDMVPGSFLQIGQRLVIKPAPTPTPGSQPIGGSGSSEPEATAGVDNVGSAESTADVVAAAPTEALPSPTPQPAFSATPAPPAPVVAADAGQVNPAATAAAVCVSLFEDDNANRIQEEGEKLLVGGRISLKSGAETIAAQETDGVTEQHCFTDLTPGDYVAVASAPTGFGLTTSDQFHLRVQTGTTLSVAFGAAPGVAAAAPPPADSGAADTVSSAPEQTVPPSTSDQLVQMSGVIVLGLAAVALVGGLVITLLLRRR